MTTLTIDQLEQDIEAFLVFKAALGSPYRRGGAMLASFKRFAQERTTEEATIELEATLSAWLARAPERKPVTVTLELGVIRQLCRYRCRSNPNSFVPGREWAPQSTKTDFLPTIFSHKEVGCIIEGATQYTWRNLSGLTLRCLILMLYCTGIRLGEAVKLQCNDVDLKRQQFTIRESKGKTRIVPFGDDLRRELQSYLDKRRFMATLTPASPWLIRLSGDAVPVKVASEAIRRLLRRLQLKPLSGRVGPRPYDFRHTFAVHRLSAWYQQGLDIHARLPWLSAYMGHDNILGTEAYLRATPELMALASARFEARLHGIVQQP